MTSLFSFLLAVAILVFLHEMGHYLAARSVGVHVERFSVGFGRALLRWRDRRGCEWVLAAIPLGGYVKMWDSERQGRPAGATAGAAFEGKPLWARAWVVAAGPLANFIFAVLAYGVLAYVGRWEPAPVLEAPAAASVASAAGLQQGDRVHSVNGTPIETFGELRWTLVRQAVADGSIRATLEVERGGQRLPVQIEVQPAADAAVEPETLFASAGLAPESRAVRVTQVQAGSPAEAAGLQAGMVLLGLNGEPLMRPQQLIAAVQSGNGQPIRLEWVETQADQPHAEQPGSRRSASITPIQAPDGRFRLGIGLAADTELVWNAKAPGEALVDGFSRTGEMMLVSLQALGRMLVGDLSWRQLSGPATIADIAGQSAGLGVLAFIGFLALISVSIGILNLLPIPMLDGGHLLYYGLEWVRGRPLPEAVQQAGQRVGLVLIAGLTVLALASDAIRFLSP